MEPGTEFAGYRIERELGRGGMGEVYLATHLGLGRKVALKVLARSLAADPRFRERLVRESRVAASIDHPNVIPIYEAGEAAGELFIAMRYVEGTDLRTLLHEGAVEVDRAVSIVRQVAGALDAAHEHGLVHRDVKPGNVLLASTTRSGAGEHAYLSDFGLTKRAASDSGVTGTGQFVGTLDYAAPEQFEGKALDARTDIYSLGCVAYECLTGHPPFRRENDASVMYAHLLEDPPKVTESRPELPAALDPVISRAMAKKPEDRYPSAGGFAQAVGEAAAGGAGTTTPTGPRPRRTGAVVAAVAATLVVALVVGLIAFAGGGSGGEPSPSPTGSDIPLNSLVQIDAETGAILQTATGMPAPYRFLPQVEIGEGGVWELSSAQVTHVDPIDASLVAVVSVGVGGTVYADSIAVGGRTVWVATAPGLVRIDPATDQRLRPIDFQTSAWVTFGGSSVWVVSANGTLWRVDPVVAEPTGSVRVGVSASGLAAGSDGVWVIDKVFGELTRVDPDTLAPDEPISIAGELDAVASGAGGVWVLDSNAGTVIPVNPVTFSVGSPIRVGSKPTDITVGLGAIWVTNHDEGTISRIDPVTDTVVDTIAVGAPVAAIAVDEADGTLWVAIAREPETGA